MTGLMDKIRAALGLRGSEPADSAEAPGAPGPEGSAPMPGEPTLGSAMGMQVDGAARQDEAQPGPTE